METEFLVSCLGVWMALPARVKAVETCTLLDGSMEYQTFECDGFCCGSPQDRTCCDNANTTGLTIWGIAGVILGVGLGVALLGVLCSLVSSTRADAQAAAPAVTTATTNGNNRDNGTTASKRTQQPTPQAPNGQKSHVTSVTVVMPTALNKKACNPAAMPRVE